MIKGNYLNINETVFFNTVSAEKNAPRDGILQTISNRVLNTYADYLNNFPALVNKRRSEFFRAGEADAREALQSCYRIATASFKTIRGKISEVQPNVLKTLCPYCLLNSPDTIDHYIGQVEFPEYSVLCKNLLPCCYRCNQLKGEVWRAKRKRRFIHYYIDNFLIHQFLFAKLIYTGVRVSIPSIKFGLARPHNINSDDFRIIRMHFKDLDLLDMYSQRANDLISSEYQVGVTHVSKGQTRQSVRDGLIVRRNVEASNAGINSWRSVTYDTLAGSSRFINSL